MTSKLLCPIRQPMNYVMRVKVGGCVGCGKAVLLHQSVHLYQLGYALEGVLAFIVRREWRAWRPKKWNLTCAPNN